MLEKLTIKGFKSIASLDALELRNINVLIGGNGAGKSNLVEFFKMMRALQGLRLAEFGDRKPNLLSFVSNKGGIGNFLYAGVQQTKEIRVSLVTTELGKYELQIMPTAEGDLASQESGFVSAGVWGVYQFHDTTQFSRVRQPSALCSSDSLEPDGGNLAAFLYAMKGTEFYDQIVDMVRLAAPYFEDFVLEPYKEGDDEKVKLQWKQQDMLMNFQPHHLSDGTLRFICLATVLLQPKPPQLIIIDEPELGLHPEALEALAELIHRCSSRTQFILATQSPSFADFFEPEQILTVTRVDGASRFERQSREKLSPWLESYSIGQLWRKNVIRGGVTNG